MGLSIFYSGSLADPALLPELISEVSDIAESFGWKINIFEGGYPEKDFDTPGFDPDDVYGLCVIPPGSEPVSRRSFESRSGNF